MSKMRFWTAFLRRFRQILGRRRDSVQASRKRYTIEELLAQCDPETPLSQEDRAWLDFPPVGRESL